MEHAIATRQMRFDGEKSDGRTLVGLAVPFNQVTRIDNWMEGTFDEQFAPGAFKRTLNARTPKLQFDHGSHPLFGSMPIGEFRKLTETKKGLEVEARLFEAPVFEPLREAMASDALDGMSIRFRPLQVTTVDADARDDGGEVDLRTITEVELVELGPVVFPAYAGTEVEARMRSELSHHGLDKLDENERLRLAMALAFGASTIGNGPDHKDGPSTDPEAGPPALRSDPDSLHSDSNAPRQTNRRRARVARLRTLESEHEFGATTGAAARSS